MFAPASAWTAENHSRAVMTHEKIVETFADFMTPPHRACDLFSSLWTNVAGTGGCHATVSIRAESLRKPLRKTVFPLAGKRLESPTWAIIPVAVSVPGEGDNAGSFRGLR